MFGFGGNKKTAAADQAFDAIEALCRPYIRSGKLTQIIKTDPYVAGFLGMRVPGVCVMASLEHGLNQSDAKEVIAIVLLKLYGSTDAYTSMLANANALRQSGDEKFRLGCERGKKFMAYAQQKEDITADPDFPKAMDIARSMGLPQSNDMSLPLAGLDRIWFGSYMEQYL